MLTNIDAFQIRCWRGILRISSTFIDRRNPNRVVLQRCTVQKSFTKIKATNGNLNFLANLITAENPDYRACILRSRDEDPMRQVSFQPSSAIRVQYGKKRVGCPRQNWLHFAKNNMFSSILFVVTNTSLRGYEYNETVVEDTRIYNAAITRTF
jgi:hypothetical protein